MKRLLIHGLIKLIHFVMDKLDDLVFTLVLNHLDDIFTGEEV